MVNLVMENDQVKVHIKVYVLYIAKWIWFVTLLLLLLFLTVDLILVVHVYFVENNYW